MGARMGACIAMAAVCLAADPERKFRADVPLVVVDAQVLAAGEPVHGLTSADFRVAEDGRPRPILYFDREEMPIDLLLLIDVSGSMRDRASDLAAEAEASLGQLRPGDRVGAMIFDSRRRLTIPLEEARDDFAERLIDLLGEETFLGGTDIHNAVYDGARYLREAGRRDARRAILILTDNFGLKKRSESSVVSELWEAGAVLNALIFQGPVSPAMRGYRRTINPWLLFWDADVTRIAAQTGGESLKAASPEAGLERMFHHIRHRYVIQYRAAPGPAGDRRKIAVELSASARGRYPQAVVRARRGYVLPDDLRE